MTYIAHFCIGLMGMGAGFVGRHFCPHRRHQLIVSGALLAVESIVTVSFIG